MDDSPFVALTVGYNTWISVNYCKDWLFLEGIREVLQNQMDGMTSVATKKAFIDPIPLAKDYNGKKYKNYEFRNTQNRAQILGEIIYDPGKEMLSVWNIGHLETGDLLLGGTKDLDDNVELIGRFGEGMKLSALALLRAGKPISIMNGTKV